MPAYPVSYGCNTYFTDVDPSKADNMTVLEAVYGVASVFWNYTGEAGQCNDMGAQGPSTLGTQDGVIMHTPTSQAPRAQQTYILMSVYLMSAVLFV